MNWSARIASIILALLWGFLAWFLVADLEYGLPPTRGLALFALAIFACLALFAAWRWPRAGGWTAVVAALAFAILGMTTMPSGPAGLAMIWMAFPFVLTGLLFVAGGETRAGRLRLSRPAATALSALVILVFLALVAATLLLGVGGVVTTT